jgi:hypothetical protein
MTSSVCTLFEGDYHYGVGALSNSLYAHGYRGTMYAGYRGPLPPWAVDCKEFDGFSEFSPAEGLTLRFIPLAPKVHFTNYKPDFMLEVWEKHCPEADALFYFDPDITIKCRWTFFEEWVGAGVAVCQDINGSMADNHPIRHAWRKLLQPGGLVFRNCFDNYFNGGFVGLCADDHNFLSDWQRVQSLMQKCGADFQSIGVGDRTFPFTCRDQDALNITCMVTRQKISPVGPDGMDFQRGGGYIMSHAVGRLKPWDKSFIRLVFLRAAPPTLADKGFFRHLKFPIRPYKPAVLLFNRLRVLVASFLGRFARNS